MHYERSFKWKVGHFRNLCAVSSLTAVKSTRAVLVDCVVSRMLSLILYGQLVIASFVPGFLQEKHSMRTVLFVRKPGYKARSLQSGLYWCMICPLSRLSSPQSFL